MAAGGNTETELDAAFDIIQSDLGEDWLHLALKLGLNHIAIQEILYKCGKDLTWLSRSALEKWRQGKGKKATLEELLTALKRAGRQDLVDSVEEHLCLIKGMSSLQLDKGQGDKTSSKDRDQTKPTKTARKVKSQQGKSSSRESSAALHEAAEHGDTVRVKQLLEEGVNPNATYDILQSTPLSKAAGKGHHETISVLLAAGANVNIQDRQQRTPLHWAAGNGHHETVSALLAAGANVNTRDWQQRTPLHLAAENGHHETVSALLAAGADVNIQDWDGRTPLHEAAENGHHETVSVLLAAGADVNIQDRLQMITPLSRAAQNGHHETVSALLAAGADVNIQDRLQRTPLHLAAENGHHETVSVLLAAGADVNVWTSRGSTRRYLIAPRPADVRGPGPTPLQLAAEKRHLETVSVLLTAGADVSILTTLSDFEKNSLLHRASQSGHHENVVSALLAAGAKMNTGILYAAGLSGHHETPMTPLHLAAQNGHHKIVSALLTAGADVNAQDDGLQRHQHVSQGYLSANVSGSTSSRTPKLVGKRPKGGKRKKRVTSVTKMAEREEPQRRLRDDEAGPSGIRMVPRTTDFQQMLGTILSRLDKTDVRLLMRVWSSRTGKQASSGAGVSADLMKDMMKNEYILTGNLRMLEKDMMAAGISFPAIVRDIPGVPEELKYTRTTEAAVGPMGGELEIPGFVKLVVPPGALQQTTMITISTVDVAAILRDPESVNWISGYPWSQGEAVCPRELLDQVLFSPAVDVNLHGAELNGDLEVQTWRPPGSEGMECLVLKHHDGEGWTDITASTVCHKYSDKLSIFLQSFSPVANVWAPLDALISVGKMVVNALSSRTLDCRFAAYIKPMENDVQFHVVCRDQSVETNEYLPGFTKCGSNAAMFDLFHGDVLDVAVSVRGGQKESKPLELRSKQCRDRNGQNIQIFLDRPSGDCVKGEVDVKKVQVPSFRTVCQFIFQEEDNVSPSDDGKTKGHSKKRSKSNPPLSKKKRKESESQQRDEEAGPSGVGADTGAVDVEESFEKVIAGVSSKWDDLARKLGFSENQIDGIHTSKIDQDRRCREMLRRWRNRKGRKATLHLVLKRALIDIGEGLTAESL